MQHITETTFFTAPKPEATRILFPRQCARKDPSELETTAIAVRTRAGESWLASEQRRNHQYPKLY